MGAVEEGGVGSGQEGRESDFTEASASPEVERAAECEGSDVIKVRSGDRDIGWVDGEVDTFLTVVVPN